MKFSLYNGKQQLEHINETLENMMAKAGWVQSYKSEFFRLGLGYTAAAIALYVYYLEKTLSFREARFITGILCLAYFSCTWLAWLWERTYERNAFYLGSKDEIKAYIASEYPKSSEIVRVTVTKKADTNLESHTFEFPLKDVVDKYSVVHQEELAPVVEYFRTKQD